MPLGGRRAGPAKSFDVFAANGSVVARNLTAAAVVASYATSLTAQAVIDRVAAEHHVVSDTYRVTAHMAILGTPLYP